MHLANIQRILGLLLFLLSGMMLLPLGVAWLYRDGQMPVFWHSLLGLLALGGLLWLPVRHRHHELRLKDAFVVVVLFWCLLGLAGAIPLLLTGHPDLLPTDALFEAVSGVTTTGATVLSGIDRLPPSVQFYRQELQWVGGMGIIVLAVAVQPLLGIGGIQLYRAEAPGTVKETRLTPRIAETARALWLIYVGLTALCALAYRYAGMEPFDAIAHSLSTISLGGFSTHDLNMGYYQNTSVEVVCVLFMLLSGLNFALHFMALRQGSPAVYWRNAEARTFLLVILLAAAIAVAHLYLSGTFADFASALHYGIFQAVSIGTTAGFTTAGYAYWPGFLPVLLLFTSFIGGCAGSTGGGMKVIRFLLLLRQGVREIHRLIHTNARIPVKIGRRAVSDRVVDAVWGFFATYVGVFAVMLLALMATGLDQVTAFSAVAACINNLGPGLGEVGFTYADLSDPAKWVLILTMLMGRMELFSVLVLLSPGFWRR